MAGTVRPSRIARTKLNALAVRYYTLNEQGQIDRLILNDVTGDLWKYGVLDDVKNLAFNASSILGTLTGSGSSGSGDSSSGNGSSGSGSGSTGDGSSGSGSTGGTTTTTVVDDLRSVLVPTTSEILWGVIDGSLLSTVWNRITSSSGSLLSIGLKQLANITGQPMSTILNFVGGGAAYHLLRQRQSGQLFHLHQVSGAGGRSGSAAKRERHGKGHDPADAHEDRSGGCSLGDKQRHPLRDG
ncbi:MAG: hypothetical protein ACLU9R_04420 [Faecalibacterium sp.]